MGAPDKSLPLEKARDIFNILLEVCVHLSYLADYVSDDAEILDLTLSLRDNIEHAATLLKEESGLELWNENNHNGL